MHKNLLFKSKFLFIIGLSILCLNASGQENRSFDGYGNNMQHPDWGAVGTNQLQIVTNGFADGVSEPGGIARPNPRIISNAVFSQVGLLPDDQELSDYAWVWGQFIDHNITLVADDPNEPVDIAVPAGDPFFDPTNTGAVVIGMHRSAYDPASGTSPANPRAFPTGITSFIDASGIYGSNETRANWLRTFESGKLRMSSGNFLPYNTTTGEYEAAVDPTAPEMAMPFPFVTKWFVSGDVRANENPLLTSFHTLFTREHNRLCDQLAAQNPSWTDEQLYQHARKIVGGLIQSIAYNEWLPTMGVELEPYAGYDPSVNPGIMNVFSAAAYRYGHSVINSSIVRMDNDGNIIPQGNILLRDAFFNPTVIVESGGLDPLLKGMTAQMEQNLDCKMVDDLRNFLFGPPGAGGLDLAAININRGRERGLPDYNTARTDFGLPPVESFMTLTSNPWFNQILESVYGDINNIDPWVGFLAEDHMANTLFGETMMTIMKRQFTALRNGDRFYYENDAGLSQEEIDAIKNTHFKDVILRNTNVTNIQDNVFLMELPSAVAHIEHIPFELTVYPNPVSNNLFVKAAAIQPGKGILQISDILGHVVQEKTAQFSEGVNTFEFDMDGRFPAGLYNVTLTMENQVGHQKFFKE